MQVFVPSSLLLIKDTPRSKLEAVVVEEEEEDFANTKSIIDFVFGATWRRNFNRLRISRRIEVT